MRVHVEFLGLSRLIIGSKQMAFDLPEGTSFRDLVRLLRSRYPGLVDNVIRPDGETLQAPNVFNLDGKRMVRQDQMSEAIHDEDRIILMSLSAGG